MILVDTAVWIEHFRRRNDHLSAKLRIREVLMHPFVLGEIACGHLPNRDEFLRFLKNLPVAKTVADNEALYFLETHAIRGRGIGYLDVHLLASVAITGNASIWTYDKRLHSVASGLELAYENA